MRVLVRQVVVLAIALTASCDAAVSECALPLDEMGDRVQLGLSDALWPTLLRVDGEFELYFTNSEFPPGPTLRSTSADGIAWSSPREVLQAPFSTVLVDEDGHHAWFARGGGWDTDTPPSIGYARSSDGIDWEVSTSAFGFESGPFPNGARPEDIDRLAAWKTGTTYHLAFGSQGTEFVGGDLGIGSYSIGHLSGEEPDQLDLVGWPAVSRECPDPLWREGVRPRFTVSRTCSACRGSIGLVVQWLGCDFGYQPTGDVELMRFNGNTAVFSPYEGELGPTGTLLVGTDGDTIAIEVDSEGGQLSALRRDAPRDLTVCGE